MISVIIPVYNEERSIGKLIRFLKNGGHSGELEIIISDGGSTDGTIREAREHGALVLQSPKKGRASQMNYGAEKARGEILYFLHADTFPPKNFVSLIRQHIDEKNGAGCFRLAFDHRHYLLSAYSWFTRFDIDLVRFGDQSLFVTDELFSLVGGFDEKLIVMEDQDMVRKLKKHSGFIVSNQHVITSARKYREVGILKLQLIFTAILGMYYLGVSQDKLVQFYRRSITNM